MLTSPNIMTGGLKPEYFIRKRSGVFRNPLLLSLGPCMIVLSLCLIVTSCDLNSAMYPSSHSLTIETSDLSVILGMMCSSRASSCKADKYSRHGFLDCMVLAFRHPTLMGGPMFI